MPADFKLSAKLQYIEEMEKLPPKATRQRICLHEDKSFTSTRFPESNTTLPKVEKPPTSTSAREEAVSPVYWGDGPEVKSDTAQELLH